MKTDIFIAYRRNDGGYEIAGRMYERLTRLGYSCFWDENLSSGDYDDHLKTEIAACVDFVMVLPINALKKRYEGTDHFIDEVEFALKLKKNIVAVFLDGYDPKDDIMTLGKKFEPLLKLENPMHIFRPQKDKEKKCFQKSAFNLMINDMESHKLLKSKRVIKYITVKKIVLTVLTCTCVFTILQIDLLRRDSLLRNENYELSKKIDDMENQIDYWDGNIADSYESGNGTKEDPYIIATPQQLALVASVVEHGESYEDTYFKVANDIYLNDTETAWQLDVNGMEKGVLVQAYQYEWKPIGQETAFAGYFDGNGKNIYGLSLNEEKTYQGLFGRCKTDSVITDVNVWNGNIRGMNSVHVGIICGKSDGIINNCNVVSSNVEGKSLVGGIVGEGNIVLNCGVISLGISCTCLSKSNLEGNRNNVDLTKECNYFGGIAGRCQIVANSEVVKVTSSKPGYVFGGLVGKVDVEMFNCACKDISIGIDKVNFFKPQ